MNKFILNHIELNHTILNTYGSTENRMNIILSNQWLWDDGKEIFWDDGKDMYYDKFKKVKKITKKWQV